MPICASMDDDVAPLVARPAFSVAPGKWRVLC